MNKPMRVKVEFSKDTADLLRRFGLEKGGTVQMAIDHAVVNFCEEYVPFDEGLLTSSAKISTVYGSGEVIYNTPYAHFLYYGEVYGPNIPVFERNNGIPTRYFSPKGKPKHPTGKQLKYNQEVHTLAGPFWAQRMWADHEKDIIREAKAHVKH